MPLNIYRSNVGPNGTSNGTSRAIRRGRSHASRKQKIQEVSELGLEAPPGFEPGMEVLQTSALPLGDGAGRKRHLDYRGFPAASMRRNSTGENRRSSHRHPRTAHPGKSTRNRHPNSRNGAGRRSASVVKAARRGAGAPALDTRAAGTELASTRQRSEGCQAGCRGPRDRHPSSRNELASTRQRSEGCQAGCRGPRDRHQAGGTELAAKRQRSGGRQAGCRGPRDRHQAGGTELAAKRQRSGDRQAGCRGPRRSINGAGNGIRTRDFDLGKVALYH
jgi:hypothetical protein